LCCKASTLCLVRPYSHPAQKMFNLVMNRATETVGSMFNSMITCLTFGGYAGQKKTFDMRDIGFVKSLFRMTGMDKYDDFEFVLVVHDISYEHTKRRFPAMVRVRAGANIVETDTYESGVFQQPFAIQVDQGTQDVKIELIDKGRSRVVATLNLDVDTILGAAKKPVQGKLYTMTPKNKALLKPRVQLSIAFDDVDAVEDALLENGLLGDDSDSLPPQVQGVNSEMSDLINELRGAYSCEDLPGLRSTFMAVAGPPQQQRYCLAFWKDRQSYQNERPAEETIDLLKIQSVAKGGKEGFVVKHVKGPQKSKHQFTLHPEAIPTTEAMNMLIRLIKMTHDAREKA